MKKILIDIDGVLADFWDGFSRVLRYLNPAVDLCTGLSRKAYTYTEAEQSVINLAWDVVRNSPHFWRNLPAMCGCDAFFRLEKLRKAHELYFVTARIGLHPQQDTLAWLIKQGMGCATVIVPEHKMSSDSIPYSDKGSIAKAVGIQWALEDSPLVANRLLARGCQDTYLINRPYNKDVEFLQRVDTVLEFIDLVEKA